VYKNSSISSQQAIGVQIDKGKGYIPPMKEMQN